MVDIIESTWKDHLTPNLDPECTSLPSPESLRKKILVKVKHVDPKRASEKSSPSRHKSRSPRPSSSSASEVDDLPTDVKKKTKKSAIIPSLSALGVYTRAYHFKSLTTPEATIPNHVFALSEKKLMEYDTPPSSGPTLFSHNRNYLMRAYPSGMRVRSDNLDPAPFWRKGVQMVALNWQRWDEGMMLNEGMFTGSKGYILKPDGYRGSIMGSSASEISAESETDAIAHKTLALSIELFAAQDIPLPLGDTKPEGFHPYLKCELHVEKPAERSSAPIERGGKTMDGEFKWTSRSMKGSELDFGGEKVEFRAIPGVVEELSFLRYVLFLCCHSTTLIRHFFAGTRLAGCDETIRTVGNSAKRSNHASDSSSTIRHIKFSYLQIMQHGS